MTSFPQNATTTTSLSQDRVNDGQTSVNGDQPDARIEWREDGVPVSTRFDDPYYSLQDGLAETRYVFLEGNDLPTRFNGASHFHVAELGFGTGLNLLAVWQLWREAAPAGSVLHYTSFEAFPLATDALAKAHANWPELAELSLALCEVWSAKGPRLEVSLPSLELSVVFGDARRLLPAEQWQADAWFLDGFAPRRNPELWEENLLQEVAAHTVTNGSFATYTAAGFVRRALDAAGFEVTKRKGFAHKRDMSMGKMMRTDVQSG